jgi:hypothetical protein
LNAQLSDWIERVAYARNVPGDANMLVRDALAEERSTLLPLPDHPVACDYVGPIASGKTPYVRFDTNNYSIPHDRIRQPLTLVASETEVRILDGTKELARHARSYDRGRLIENPAHIEGLAQQKRRARELRGRDRLRASCRSAETFIAELAQRGVSMARHTTRLIKLLDQYGADELEIALADSLTRGALSADAVASWMDQRARARRQPPPLDIVLPSDPRVRDLRITPHPLADYDKLTETSKSRGRS